MCFTKLLYVIPGTPKTMDAYRAPVDADWVKLGKIGEVWRPKANTSLNFNWQPM
jgi:hypothetical protein